MGAVVRWVVVLSVLVSALALVACGGDGDDASSDDGRSSRSNDRDRDGIPDRRDDCPRDKENEGGWDDDSDGCPDTIDDLIELGRSDVDAFWRRTFEENDLDYEPPRVFQSYTREIDTPCGPTLLGNAFYCLPAHGIYFDQALFERELETNGDFAVVFILAHEWGHLAQGLLGVLGDSQFFSIQIELQADCYAGAYARDADERGILESGDFEEAIVTLFRVGDPLDTMQFEEGAHGTPGQRIDAFQRGYQDGVGGCDIGRFR